MTKEILNFSGTTGDSMLHSLTVNSKKGEGNTFSFTTSKNFST